MRFHSFDDVQDHLDALGLFHMDFGLDRMRNALDALGLLTPPFVTVQIVGTNGKGSTSTFLSCVARAHGLKVGLYTSPHFVTPRERIRINGTMLPADRWPVLADRVMEAAPNLTYFEFLTALGLLAFAEAGVDLVVMEAGLGGPLRRHNGHAGTGRLLHAHRHGPRKNPRPYPDGTSPPTSRRPCAPGVPAFTAPQEAEAFDCLLRTAQEKGAELRETASLPFPQSALGSPAAPARQCPAGHRRMGLARRSAPLAQYARNRRQGAGFRALPRTVPAHPGLQRPAAPDP